MVARHDRCVSRVAGCIYHTLARVDVWVSHCWFEVYFTEEGSGVSLSTWVVSIWGGSSANLPATARVVSEVLLPVLLSNYRVVDGLRVVGSNR